MAEPDASSRATAIVGAGWTGLVLGYRLARRGEAVTIFEQAAQPGGLATYEDYGGFYWDRFYHVILPTDDSLIGFLTELGLGESFFWSPTRTGYYSAGRTYPVGSAIEFLRFPLLGFVDKLRLAAALLYAARVKDWRRLERITCEEWLVRLCGRRVYERFWRPLLRAKLGDCHNEVSAVFIWTYIQRLASARRTAAHRECLGHVAGGYHAILSRLIAAIESAGGRVVCGTAIRRIAPNGAGDLCVETAAGVHSYQRVVFTGPAEALQAAVAPELVEVDAGAVKYLGVLCMVLVTNKPVSPYYALNIADERVPFTGVIGMSTVVPREQTGGRYLTYFPKYVPAGDPLLSRSDGELQEMFLEGARCMFPGLDPGAIVSVRLHRAQRVQPLQTLNYADKAPRVATRHRGLFVLNTAQLLDGTLNNNSVVRHVDAFVKTLPPAGCLTDPRR